MRSLRWSIAFTLAALVAAPAALAQKQPPSKSVAEARQRADTHLRAAEKAAVQRRVKTDIELRRAEESVRAKATQQGPQVKRSDQAVATPRDHSLAGRPVTDRPIEAASRRSIEVPANAIAGRRAVEPLELPLVEEQQLRVITETELLQPTEEFYVEVGRPGFHRHDRIDGLWGDTCRSGVEIERRYVDRNGHSLYLREPYQPNFVDTFGRTRYSRPQSGTLHRGAMLRFSENSRNRPLPTPRERRFDRDDRRGHVDLGRSRSSVREDARRPEPSRRSGEPARRVVRDRTR